MESGTYRSQVSISRVLCNIKSVVQKTPEVVLRSCSLLSFQYEVFVRRCNSLVLVSLSRPSCAISMQYAEHYSAVVVI